MSREHPGADEQALLLRAIDATSRRLMVVSRDLRLLAGNGPIRQSLQGAVAGRACHEAFFARTRPCPGCPVADVLARHRPVSKDADEMRLAGNDLCLYAAPIFAGERIESIAVLDYPISDSSENERRQSRHFLWSPNSFFVWNLMLSSADAVIAADTKGKILIFNDAAAEVTGYTVDEALSGLNIVRIYPGEGAREIMRKLRSEYYGGKGKLKSHEVEILRKDGTAVPVSLSAAVVYEGYREVATIGFFRDLSEKKRMERELQQTQLQLLQAEKMASLGKMAAGVAHQLNNPLAGIVLFSEILRDEYDLEEKARDDLRQIIEGAKICRHIVQELLEFSRQTAQKIRPDDLNGVLLRTLGLLENQRLFRELEIVRDLDPELPPVPLDAQQLSQVFMNILLNAAEAMEGKGILTIRTVLEPAQDRVRIEIADTGPGIPEEVQPRIFEPFFTTKDVGKGTGLGLSIAYGIIENHRGTVSVRSRPGEGATFVICLPLAGPATDSGGCSQP
ncbi:MAG: ATP-binding protein [bacterium]